MRHKPSLKNGAKTVMDIARQFEVEPRQPGGDSKIQVTVVGGRGSSWNRGAFVLRIHQKKVIAFMYSIIP
jgi:hypothetical protein